MIRFEDGTEIENIGGIYGTIRSIRGNARDSLEIYFDNIDYATLASLFVDGARFSIVDPSVDIPGEEIVYEKYEYEIAGDIVDKRDGTFVVYMGAKTDMEAMEEELAETMLMLIMGGE